MKCNVCGKGLPPMPPEMEARAVAESKARGDWVEDPKARVVVCDPCWQRARANGWEPPRRN